MGLELLVDAADSLNKTEKTPAIAFKGILPTVERKTQNIKLPKIMLPNLSNQLSQSSSNSTKDFPLKESGKIFSISHIMSHNSISEEPLSTVKSNSPNEGSSINNLPDQSPSKAKITDKSEGFSKEGKEYYESLLKKYGENTIREILALNSFMGNRGKEASEKGTSESKEVDKLERYVSTEVQKEDDENHSENLTVQNNSSVNVTVANYDVSSTKDLVKNTPEAKQASSSILSTLSIGKAMLRQPSTHELLTPSNIDDIENGKRHSFNLFMDYILDGKKSQPQTKEPITNESTVNEKEKKSEKIETTEINNISLQNVSTTQIFKPTSVEMITSQDQQSFSNSLRFSSDIMVASTTNSELTSAQQYFILPSGMSALNMQRNMFLHSQKNEAQSKLYQQDEDGDTLLHIAIAKEDIKLAKAIIEKMTSFGLNLINRAGQAALHLASYLCMDETVSDLILNGADAGLVDKEGNTFLHIGVLNDSIELVKVCLNWRTVNPKNEFILTKRNNRGLTPLHIAVERENEMIATMLSNHECCINIVEQKSGETPLLMALKNECWSIVDILLQNNADVNLPSYSGLYPLYIASTAAKEDLVTRMTKLGAKLGKPKELSENSKINTNMKKLLDNEMRRRRRKRKTEG